MSSDDFGMFAGVVLRYGFVSCADIKRSVCIYFPLFAHILKCDAEKIALPFTQSADGGILRIAEKVMYSRNHAVPEFTGVHSNGKERLWTGSGSERCACLRRRLSALR